MAPAETQSVAQRWREIEASLSPEERSRTKRRDGRVRPYRPCPPDFREMYIRLGWHAVDAHYRTNWYCIARWIDECGRSELKAARAAYVRAQGYRRLHPEK